MVDIYEVAKLRGKYLLLGTDPEGDHCFSIIQAGFKKIYKIWAKTSFTTKLLQFILRATT